MSFIDISKSEFGGKNVLVLGTGYGKELPALVKYNCKNIYAIDNSIGIHIAHANYSNTDNIHCIMADINSLPFSLKFDIIVADHVLCRLPDLKVSFKSITNALAVNGIFAGDIFSYENNFLMHKIIEPDKRIFFNRFSINFIAYFSFLPALICFIVIKRFSQ